ncbi:putative enoyl-CoA hydratase/isomerase, ClpP/crotonase-like domain superfamily [Septoria linicola]|nr:putative enoyl-CoA hydratase/isomerase, ClpP/crotonase-like domain superfamily [Septoria linicola]
MPSPPTLENVSISLDSQEPAIALLKFNRPKNANALNVPLVQDYLTALRWTEEEPSVRIIITTGEGKFFTAGLDLLDPTVKSTPGATISDAFISTLSSIHTHLIQTPKLLISAVNGPAPGWGTTHIVLSDLVYASPSAFFFTPFVQWGLCAEGCSSSTFWSVMGRQKASALILAGQRMSAEELERAGLVTKVLAEEGFLEGVLGIARGVAGLPEESLRFNKQMLVSKDRREELLRCNEVEMEALREQVRKKESLDAIEGFKRETERKKREKAEKGRL